MPFFFSTMFVFNNCGFHSVECNRFAHDEDEIKKRKGEDAGT